MRFFNAETQRRGGFLEGTPARVCLTTENTESTEGFGGHGCVFLTQRRRGAEVFWRELPCGLCRDCGICEWWRRDRRRAVRWRLSVRN